MAGVLFDRLQALESAAKAGYDGSMHVTTATGDVVIVDAARPVPADGILLCLAAAPSVETLTTARSHIDFGESIRGGQLPFRPENQGKEGLHVTMVCAHAARKGKTRPAAGAGSNVRKKARRQSTRSSERSAQPALPELLESLPVGALNLGVNVRAAMSTSPPERWSELGLGRVDANEVGGGLAARMTSPCLNDAANGASPRGTSCSLPPPPPPPSLHPGSAQARSQQWARVFRAHEQGREG